MARTLITSALPYINGVKHLGNLVGSMLPADVFARWRRLRGDEVLFICATDEHGTPAELAALNAGRAVADYCAEMWAVQKRLCDGFALSWDWFGRSSSPQNRELTQHFCKKLDENGLIAERSTRQVYSIDDGRFLPDRYIEGTCPNCGYDRARGDQCENCTKLLDPTDLINPRSAVSGGTRIEVRETRHLYLLQEKMQARIAEWIDAKTDWPNVTVSIARKWLNEGLRERAITRDLSWGVPVADENGPRPGFEGKVFYVWFDAPIEYIGATWEWADGVGGDWRRWWREDEGAGDVRYYQFMAKDNVPFHTVGFPITLFGSGEPWKVVDYIKGFNWLTFYGGKFSTSQGRGVFMDAALEIRPADDWRWWLMANAPESADSSFTWESFQATVNKDLADILGNFVNRILRFAKSRFGGEIPDGGAPGALEAELTERLDVRLGDYARWMDAMEFRRAAAELRAIWDLGNEYLTRAEPWTHVKTDRDRAALGVRVGINLIRLFAILSQPFIPDAAAKMRAALGVDDGALTGGIEDAATALAALPPGHGFATPEVLFTKIADEDIDAWRSRFGGDPEPA